MSRLIFLYITVIFLTAYYDRVQVDILHPFASLEWRECGVKFPAEKFIFHAAAGGQSVYLDDKVYISGPPPAYYSGGKTLASLYIYTPATDSWETIDTPVYGFALTTYHSQLVLVGGINCDDESPAAKLWTLSEDGQWQETLPPMETACTYASAVSHGDHLLVVDGDWCTVSVYNGR